MNGAAGLGNAVSDVVGIGAGSVVERWAERLGMAEGVRIST